MKKSNSYVDSSKIEDLHFLKLQKVTGRSSWINNIGVLGELCLLKGDYDQSINYSRIAFDTLIGGGTQSNRARNLAHAKLLANQLDSVEYFLNIAEKAAKNQPDYYARLATILQVRALYKTEIGALNDAEKFIQKCWQIIEERKLNVNAPQGIIAPDFFWHWLESNKKNIVRPLICLKEIQKGGLIFAPMFYATTNFLLNYMTVLAIMKKPKQLTDHL